MKGKPSIMLGSTTQVERLRPQVQVFMRTILSLEPHEYLLTDESFLSDFRQRLFPEKPQDRVKAVYGLTLARQADLSIVEIVALLVEQGKL